MTTRFRRQAMTIRTALILGFGLVLGLWLWMGFSFARRFADVEENAVALNDRYLRAQDVLAIVRTHTLLGAANVRDALLDPDATDGYRRQLDGALAAAERAVNDYTPILDTAVERGQVMELRASVAGFRRAMFTVLEMPRVNEPAVVRDLLNRAVLPARDAVIEAVEQAQALNREAFVQQQQATMQTYGGIEARGWQQLALVLVVTLGIALIAIVYSGWLEGRLRRQQAEEARTARDLQHLSAKLISVQEDERRAIARELHDEIGQALTAIKVELAYTQRAVATTGGPAQLLDEAQSITDGVLRSVRDLSQLLHPPLLDDMGLPAAIDWYIGGFGRRHPIEIDLQTDRMDERVPLAIETAAYRILQEALTNVAKHAGASTCRVHLRRTLDALLLTVADDGRGFDAASLQRTGARRGLGLIGIRERVAQLEGTLTIDSSPAIGTTLTITLPVAQAPAADAASEDASPMIAALPRPQVSHE